MFIKGRRAMTDVPQKPPKCSRCGSMMELVANIAPFGGRPGLVAHLCPTCNHTLSLLLAAGGEPPESSEIKFRNPAAGAEPQASAQQQQQPQPDPEKDKE
jgi:hypothetical protein